MLKLRAFNSITKRWRWISAPIESDTSSLSVVGKIPGDVLTIAPGPISSEWLPNFDFAAARGITPVGGAEGFQMVLVEDRVFGTPIYGKTLAEEPDWSSVTEIGWDGIVRESDGVNDLIWYLFGNAVDVLDIGTWTPETDYPGGALVRPTVPNGRVYAINPDYCNNWPGSSGAEEPVWPTDGRSKVMHDGDLAWTDLGIATDLEALETLSYDFLPPLSPPGYIPPQGQERFAGALLSPCAASGETAIPWSHSGGDNLLNLTDPLLPTFIEAGVYAITLRFGPGIDMTLGAVFMIQLSLVGQTDASETSGPAVPTFPSPNACVSLVTVVDAGQSIQAIVYNGDDLVTFPGDYGFSVQKIS